MYFLFYYLFLVICYNYSDVIVVFKDMISMVFSMWFDMFYSWIFVNKNFGNDQFVDICVFVVFCVCNCRF